MGSFINAVLGAIGAAVGAWLIAQIPVVRKWIATQFETRPHTCVAVISVLVGLLLSTLVLFAYDQRFLFPGDNSVAFYKCARHPDPNINANWVSLGCVDQVSTMNTCENLYWAGGGVVTKSHECEKIGTLRYDDKK
jgi:hypothetical protein